ncbi:MAG: DUF4345 family protein [Alphaproteobacteria bacterium]|nr:DUF4345 family protein [Alphaproteobacteria bacterium]
MDLPWYLCLAGSTIGAGLGVFGLVTPQRAARLVRLRDDPERPGGGAEFRGTYGGLFLGTHLVVIILLHTPYREMTLGAALAVAAAWGVTALGRLLSMALDPPSRTGFNGASVGFELVITGLIAAPVVAALT